MYEPGKYLDWPKNTGLGKRKMVDTNSSYSSKQAMWTHLKELLHLTM